ncbi:MAG: DNA polymerase IV, partial [Desulfobacterota bacterium]|nr:DNA polymerase IV [Thermodesulfobacteriota bacterium]
MERIVLHIDMDAFYASVEQLDHPDLRGKPVIVGGSSNRGVVSAASYEARKFGVRSAMPIFQAKKRCPQGIFVPVRMGRYKEMSDRVMEILEKYSPVVEQVSIDEAYLDLSGLERLHGSVEQIGRRMKEEIMRVTSLSCSVGIAPNKFLAKVASEANKPDGLTVIPSREAAKVAQNLPLGKVPGVGKKSVERLEKLKVVTLGDVLAVPETALLKVAGKFAYTLLEFARGEDDSPVVSRTDAKSISSEETFEENTSDFEVLRKELLVQAEEVGRRLRKHGLKGSTVTLKLRRADFARITRSISFSEATDSTEAIYVWALNLLEAVDLSGKFRLIGVAVSGFAPGQRDPAQLSLFEREDRRHHSWREVEKAMDSI